MHILKNLIKAKRADCIAHPFVGIYLSDILDDPTEATRAIADNELADILQLGKNNQIAWELNTRAIFADPQFAKRLWAIGNEVGVKFLLGTDAHHLSEIEEPKVIELKIAPILTRSKLSSRKNYDK
jgi:histidinol phosphatase-like PHP family hydrolase